MSKRFTGLAAFALALAVAGCSGSDGAQGPQGPEGAEGPPGPAGPQIVATTEACATCHDPSLADKHAIGEWDQVQVTVQSTALNAVSGKVELKFNVKVAGVNRDDFTTKAAYNTSGGIHIEDMWWVYDVTTLAGQRKKFDAGAGAADRTAWWTLQSVGNGTGNYVASIDATLIGTIGVAGNTVAVNPGDPGTRYMVSIRDAAGSVATAVGMIGPQPHDVVGDEACMNCHGLHVWRAQTEPSGADHYGAARPQGVQPCLFCHNRAGAGDPRMSGAGVGLMSYIHGIHNSEAMPSGGYRPYWSPNYLDTISIGFPGYMNNCSTCHDSAARLAAVTGALASWDLCSSCHGTAKIGNAPSTPAAMNHATFTKATDCQTCHAGATVDTFHDGLKTERAGLIWNGADQSVVWGKRVKMNVVSVGYDAGAATTLVVTWKTSWDPDGDGTFTDTDPCNADFALGPVFVGTAADTSIGRSDENMSLLRAYMQGDDFSNNLSTSSPGQPNSVNIRKIGTTLGLSGTKNTSCAGNVATTKVPAENVSGRVPVPTRGIVAIQGKPQIRFAAAAGTKNEIIQVRAQTPTREFVLATGAQPTTARRTIVSIDKCNLCHLGSMYQHGGTRVDKIELCIMCHNPASTEQQNRTAYGLTSASTYDGKVGQTYDLRTMVHAIHSAGEASRNLVYYRSNGVYAFGSAASIAAIPNWKTTPKIECAGLSEGNPAQIVQYMVYGSVATGSVQVPWTAANGIDPFGSMDPTHACTTVSVTSLPAGYPRGTYRIFNEIAVDYPRALNDCLACHVSGPAVPNPKQAVAVTYDMGGSTVQNQLDDVLIGPSAASCLSCHQYGTPTMQFQQREHVYGNGWAPSAFPNGRQTLIDALP